LFALKASIAAFFSHGGVSRLSATCIIQVMHVSEMFKVEIGLELFDEVCDHGAHDAFVHIRDRQVYVRHDTLFLKYDHKIRLR
jgi:hypothetical protein